MNFLQFKYSKKKKILVWRQFIEYILTSHWVEFYMCHLISTS